MGILIHRPSVHAEHVVHRRGPQFRQTSFQDQNYGERGDVTLPLALSLSLMSALFMALFWLNFTFEKATKETLHDFEIRWNALEKKYKD